MCGWNIMVLRAIGFALALVVGLTLGVFIASSRPVERALYPWLIASQMVPIVAIAPLLVLWFGFDLLPKVIVVSWLIAFVEYAFQVPANRIGYGEFTGYQLKILQEVITLIVFAAFARVYLGEHIRWNYAIAFAFMVCAVAAAFWDRW